MPPINVYLIMRTRNSRVGYRTPVPMRAFATRRAAEQWAEARNKRSHGALYHVARVPLDTE